MGYPSIFPTGTTIYQKEKTYNGYTIFPSAKGALLIDMNGNEVQLWAGLGGFPNKILPGGYVMGTTGTRGGKYAYQLSTDVALNRNLQHQETVMKILLTVNQKKDWQFGVQ